MSAGLLPRTFDSLLIEEIDNKAAALERTVMSGGCKDMREYGFYSGQWVALQAVKIHIKDLVKEVESQ